MSPRIAKKVVQLVDKATVVTCYQFNIVKRRADFVSGQQGQTQQTVNDVLHVWFTHIHCTRQGRFQEEARGGAPQ